MLSGGRRRSLDQVIDLPGQDRCKTSAPRSASRELPLEMGAVLDGRVAANATRRLAAAFALGAGGLDLARNSSESYFDDQSILHVRHRHRKQHPDH